MEPLHVAASRIQGSVDPMFGLVLPVSESLVLKDFNQYAKLVADAYAKAPNREPAALPHWQALKQSTVQLFKRISSKVKVEFVDENPYPDAAAMKAEVEKTKVLKIWTGESEHEIFGQQDNLKFRAVHDYITHIVCGQPFGLKGEIAAYNRHATLAPPAALPALFTEVVGQACVAVTTGQFPPQKIAVLRGFDYRRLGVVSGHSVQNKTLVKDPDQEQQLPGHPSVPPKQPQKTTIPRAPAMMAPKNAEHIAGIHPQ